MVSFEALATEQVLGAGLYQRGINAVARDGAAPLGFQVQQLMSTPMRTCRASDRVDAVLATMTIARIRHLPIIEDNEQKGIVSIGDLVKHRLVQIGVGTCTMADAHLNFTTYFSPDVKIKVSTQGANHTLPFTCHVDAVPNDTGRAVTYNAGNTGGGQCIISDPLLGVLRAADNWQQVLSASGGSELFCTTNTP